MASPKNDAPYQSEISTNWESMELAWTEDRGTQDCVIAGCVTRMLAPFKVTIEVFSHNGGKQARRIPALVDTGQNVKEGVILSMAFCTEIGLASEILPNSGVAVSCADRRAKLKVVGRLASGVFW